MSQPPAEVAIRPMAAADIHQLVVLAQRVSGAPQWPQTAYLRALDSDAAPPRIALVAEDRGALAGFAVASLLPPQAELETIVVTAEHQRQGIGAHLLAALVGKLRPAGVCELQLEVRALNAHALAFYRRSGFVKTGLRPLYYADPEEDAVLMGLNLG
jgi:[ribosomal protein S18]-alanine N-acetyltransferase